MNARHVPAAWAALRGQVGRSSRFLLVQGVLGALAERRARSAAYGEVRSATP